MNFKDQIYLEKTKQKKKSPQPKGWDFTSQEISQVLSLQITNHFHRRYFVQILHVLRSGTEPVSVETGAGGEWGKNSFGYNHLEGVDLKRAKPTFSMVLK